MEAKVDDLKDHKTTAVLTCEETGREIEITSHKEEGSMKINIEFNPAVTKDDEYVECEEPLMFLFQCFMNGFREEQGS